MADKPKREPKLKCPLSPEQKEMVREFAETVETHRKVVKRIIGES
jgi:hypothetical protein